MKVHFDFETYSNADIKTVGAWRYSEHESTEVLCMAYAYDAGPVMLWLPGDTLPDFVNSPADYDLFAHNSFFEMSIWLNTQQWPTPSLDRWNDTAALAAAMALPRSLGGCGEALGISKDLQKDKRGAYLIQRLCKPYRGKRLRDAALMRELHDYCKQDVEAERAICNRLRPLSEVERQVWLLDQKINLRGVPVDIDAVQDVIAIHHALHEDQMHELTRLTGLSNPNSRNQFMSWLNSNGVEVEDVKRSTLEALRAAHE